MRHIYTCVDIGSDSIKVVTCELYRGRYNLLAVSSAKAMGIKKGLITDVGAAKKALSLALNETETMLGFPIKKVIAIIPSYFAEFSMIKGEINLENNITGKEIIKVLQASISGNILPNKEMVTIMPIDFKVDDQIVRNPMGLEGSKLGVRAVMATTPKKNIYSVVGLFNTLGIEVVDISLGCIGDLHTFKTNDTDNNVSCVVNIGAEKTEVTIYNKGIAVKHSIIPMGSKNVDSDVAYMYKLDLETARNLKEKFALAHKNGASLSETREVINKNKEKLKINQYEVTEIVSARIDEILTLANSEINKLISYRPDCIYITGGITNMINFIQISREKLGNCAIIGNVNLIGLRNNKYSSAIGNIIYFVGKLKLKGTNYTMVTDEDMENLVSPKKNNNDTVLGNIFNYFFGE